MANRGLPVDCDEYSHRRSTLMIGAIVGVACSLKYSASDITDFAPSYHLQTLGKGERHFHVYHRTVCDRFHLFCRNLFETGNPLFP